MRNIRRVVVVLGALSTGGVSCGLLAVGCGGDNVQSSGDSGDDGTADGTMAEAARDGTPDTAREVGPDTMPEAQPDNTVADAPQDSPIDRTMVDSGPDSPDARADSAPDVQVLDAHADADSPMDAPPDVGPDTYPATIFPTQLATALCQQVALCCFPDGGTSSFDFSACSAQYAGVGYDYSSAGANQVANGHMIFDPDAAATCINSVGMISNCTITAALQPQIITSCFGAYVGTLAAGAACNASTECTPGNVCASDGGASGFCAPLRGSGQPCGDFGSGNPVLSSEFCSYRGSGNTGFTCNQLDDAGNNLSDAGLWTCVPQYPVGSVCNVDSDCVAPMICDSPGSGTCVPPGGTRQLIFAGPGGAICPLFVLDAGAD